MPLALSGIGMATAYLMNMMPDLSITTGGLTHGWSTVLSGDLGIIQATGGGTVRLIGVGNGAHIMIFQAILKTIHGLLCATATPEGNQDTGGQTLTQMMDEATRGPHPLQKQGKTREGTREETVPGT